MDKVIATLYSIEERAQKIMETTANEKLSLKETFEEKKRVYEQTASDNINQKLSDLKVSLQKQFDEQYLESKTRTEKQLENLNEDFEKNHSQMAMNLFNRIIEV